MIKNLGHAGTHRRVAINVGAGFVPGLNSAVLEGNANWKADEHWTSPLLFTVSKVARLGKQPVNFVIGAGPTVASPEGGPNWRFRFMAVFLYPR
jgi:hypothetical protein